MITKLTKQQQAFLDELIKTEIEFHEDKSIQHRPLLRGKECIGGANKIIAQNLEVKGIVETMSSFTGRTFYAFLTKEAIKKYIK